MPGRCAVIVLPIPPDRYGARAVRINRIDEPRFMIIYGQRVAYDAPQALMRPPAGGRAYR